MQCPLHYLRPYPPLFLGSLPCSLLKELLPAIFHAVLQDWLLSPGSFILLSLDPMSSNLVFLALNSPLNSTYVTSWIFTKYLKCDMANTDFSFILSFHSVPLVLLISVNCNTIQQVMQPKNLGVILDFALSYLSCPIHQQDLLALLVECISSNLIH